LESPPINKITDILNLSTIPKLTDYRNKLRWGINRQCKLIFSFQCDGFDFHCFKCDSSGNCNFTLRWTCHQENNSDGSFGCIQLATQNKYWNVKVFLDTLTSRGIGISSFSPVWSV
jgi:hypothetical protein